MNTGIHLVEHDPNWTLAFQEERNRLADAYGDTALRIEHVGSTSVPGLVAKPVIDIQITVAAPHPVSLHQTILGELGYHYFKMEPLDATYPFFHKPERWPASHHVHLCAPGSVEERNHILFCRYLRDDASAAQDYVDLKRKLAARHRGDTQASRERYSIAKGEFVESIIERALAAGYTV